MADYFTQVELDQMKKIPEGLEKIPSEHQLKYYILALEQVSMAQTTLTRCIIQLLNAKPGIEIPAHNTAGVAVGLTRASQYVKGLRQISGYVPPVVKKEEVKEEETK